MNKRLTAGLLATILLSPLTKAADYVIDYKGAHASINFKVKHLGYSWLTGRFDKFSGTFSYDDKNVSASIIEVNIDTTSVNSNHAERDKHIKSVDFLEVNKFGNAKFVSSSVTDKGNGKCSRRRFHHTFCRFKRRTIWYDLTGFPSLPSYKKSTQPL